MRAPRRWFVIVLASLVLVQAGCAALPGSMSMRQDETPAEAVESSVQPTEVVAVSATVEPARATLTRVDVDAYPAPARFNEAAPAPVASPTAAVPERPVPATPAALVSDDYLYVPASAMARQPVTVLVALHGVGAEGQGFCKSLLAEADRHGWIVLAPTYRYENWHDPAAVVRDDLSILPRLKTAIDAVPERTGLRVRDRVLLYGFSRGGQVAHRFGLAYPERVLGVATLSAGTYTLPATEWSANGATKPLPLPFGTADLGSRLGVAADPAALGRVSFWIGVGGQDNRNGDVPAAWTPYIGPNRVERARSFRAALDRQGIPATLTVFPGADHTETPAMRAAASAYLRSLTLVEGGMPAPMAS